MGRKTYFGIPEDKRPLKDRINVVLSRSPDTCKVPDGVLLFSSLEDAVKHFETSDMQEKVENVWIVGGSSVYQEAMDSDRCHRIYFTDIHGEFECDTFFPEIAAERFKRVPNDPEIQSGIQEEDGVKYEYQIFEKI